MSLVRNASPRAARLSAVLVALALVLTACGGGDEPAASDDATTGSDSGSGVEISGTTPDEIYAELAELDPEQQQQVIEERAKEEGSVVFYSAQPVDSLEIWQERFQELYPEISVEFAQAIPPDFRERFPAEEESGNSTADVLAPGSINIPYFQSQELLANHQGVAVPEDYPEEGYGDWYIISAYGPLVLTWNTNLVAEGEEPTTYEELLDPKWKGKVAVETQPLQWLTSMMTLWSDEEITEYLRALIEDNDAVLRSGKTQLLQLQAAGEFAVSIDSYAHHVEGLKEEGAPLEWSSEGMIPANTTTMGISKNAPHPFAALLWSRFLLGQDAVEGWYDDGRPLLTPGAEYKFPRIEEIASAGEFVVPPVEEQIELEERAQVIIDEVITPHVTQ